MRKSGGMTVAHVEWEVRVTIVNSVEFLTGHESQDVVLYNWVLGGCSNVGSSSVASDGITPGKNVFKSFVLKSVLVDINETV